MKKRWILLIVPLLMALMMNAACAVPRAEFAG